MLTVILILAIVIILASLVVAALRRHDSNNYFDQDRQPFYSEPDRLVEGGLLYSQKDYETKEQHTYTVTPAGEAGLRAWLREHYGPVFRRFLALLRRAVPDVPPMELFWRVHFSLGAVIFTLSGMESLQAISKKDFNQSVTAAHITQQLLPFVVGGIQG